jgi:hypothetical protein
MTDKTNCTSCGAEILVQTATKTGGLCRPCANGTRQSVDEARRRFADEKSRDEEPFWKKWLELLSRRRSEGPSSLSEPERLFFAMNFLKGAVLRGGFHVYFSMASAEEVELARRGFRENGAPLVAEILQRASLILYPNGIPEDPIEQQNQLPGWSEDEVPSDHEPEWSPQLDEVDASFYAEEDLVHEVVESYFEAQFGSGKR